MPKRSAPCVIGKENGCAKTFPKGTSKLKTKILTAVMIAGKRCTRVLDINNNRNDSAEIPAVRKSEGEKRSAMIRVSAVKRRALLDSFEDAIIAGAGWEIGRASCRERV